MDSFKTPAGVLTGINTIAILTLPVYFHKQIICLREQVDKVKGTTEELTKGVRSQFVAVAKENYINTESIKTLKKQQKKTKNKVTDLEKRISDQEAIINILISTLNDHNITVTLPQENRNVTMKHVSSSDESSESESSSEESSEDEAPKKRSTKKKRSSNARKKKKSKGETTKGDTVRTESGIDDIIDEII